jgi:hypothetical protein
VDARVELCAMEFARVAGGRHLPGSEVLVALGAD